MNNDINTLGSTAAENAVLETVSFTLFFIQMSYINEGKCFFLLRSCLNNIEYKLAITLIINNYSTVQLF